MSGFAYLLRILFDYALYFFGKFRNSESVLMEEEIPESRSSEEKEDIVTPWDVEAIASAGIDYDKLIERFGCRRVDDQIIDRFEHITGYKAHPMLRRGLFFAHRDFSAILDRKEQGKPFYIYTGRGPSSGSLHLGHLVPFIFTKWLQEVFDVPVIIQLTDDEKMLWKDIKMDEIKKLTQETIKDIISVGFDPKKTFIFSDLDYMCSPFYENMVKIWKCVTGNQIRAIFGVTADEPIGKVAFPAIEAAPCISSSFPHIFGSRNVPCLIPCGIDQDPYFRMARDVAPRLKFPKPSLICSSFLPALQGAQSKMAASDRNSCIYLSDDPALIKKKINKYAFSGGHQNKEDHQKYGGNCEIDVSFQYLRYFLDNDEKLGEIRLKYENGEMLSGHLKAIAVEEITQLIIPMQNRRKEVDEEKVKEFTSIRPLDYAF